MPVDLSIIIVHYNAPEYLRKCLRSVEKAGLELSSGKAPAGMPIEKRGLESSSGRAGAGLLIERTGSESSVERVEPALPLETIVVDNASENFAPRLRELRNEFPRARWIENARNVGWGSAINEGARQSRGKILLFLNPDAALLPDAPRKLLDFFDNNQPERLDSRNVDSTHPESSRADRERLGPIGGKLLFSNGEIQPSAGPFPSLAKLYLGLFQPPIRRKYYARLPEAGPSRVDWVTGAFLAVRRPVFDELGGFDAEFFLYYEDVDFCLRARERGYPAYYLPGAAAYHHHPHAVREQRDAKLARIIQASRLLYFKKHRPAWETWVLSKLQLFEDRLGAIRAVLGGR